MCKFVSSEKLMAFLITVASFRRQLKKPSLSIGSEPLYWEGSTSFAKATLANLEKTLGEMIKPDDEINVTDPALPIQLTIQLKLT